MIGSHFDPELAVLRPARSVMVMLMSDGIGAPVTKHIDACRESCNQTLSPLPSPPHSGNQQMIFDRIENANLYQNLSPRIAAALKALRDTDLASRKPGKYELDGENLFAMVHHYDTRTLAKSVWEAHRNYIDVQYVAS